SEFKKERLVMGLLLGASQDFADVLSRLQAGFGLLEESTIEEPFAWTTYYEREMGPGIRRLFIMFKNPVDPGTLAMIKLKTNEIELEWTRENEKGERSRNVNIDPGMLSPARLCLATTKDRAHRLPLASGIYGELTLIYEKGQYRALPWTYPDWASERIRSLLGSWRNRCFGLGKQGPA
ncbi:MAG TPA: DUF4416 family protein, partial [Rectinemataceae bacterium]